MPKYGLAWSSHSVTIKCCNCGLPFAVPEDWNSERLRDRKNFYCPNGHQQHYIGKTEEQKLREQLEAQKAQTAREREQRVAAEKAARTARKGAAIIRGKAKAMRERVGNGVCPCCRRTFQNLLRHMHTQHPGFKGADLV